LAFSLPQNIRFVHTVVKGIIPIFYVGRTKRLLERLNDYDRFLRGHQSKQVPQELQLRLIAARRQRVADKIAVYTRSIGKNPRLIGGLPVDLLYGGEMGLFAVLLPLCNPIGRRWTYACPLEIEA
jgi:hypothetical protein